MKLYIFLKRIDGPFSIAEVTATNPAEAIRLLIAKYGRGPWSILNVTEAR